MIAYSTHCCPTSSARYQPDAQARGFVEIPRLRVGLVTRRIATRRRALTLLEVLTALAIFLMAMVVFGEMIVRNGQIARDIQRQNLATRLCKSKLQEVISGVVPLSSQGDSPFDEEPNYTWSLDADNGAVDGLWNVTVHVTFKPADASDPIQCSLTQMVLDPAVEGSTQDVVPVTVSPSNTNAGTTGGAASSPPAAGSMAAAASTPAVGTTPAKSSAPSPSTGSSQSSSMGR